MCGLHPDVDGIWKENQLTHELRKVINENREYFNGYIVPSSV